MKKYKLILALSLTVLLSACMTPKGWVKPGDTGLMQHEKTSVNFPEVIGEYKRISIIPSRNQYTGDQVIYQDKEKNRISVYIKLEQDAKEYFELSKIVMVKSGVTNAIKDKPVTYSAGGKKYVAQTQRGYGNVYEYKVGEKTLYISQMESISVFDMQSYALKIRSSVLLNPENPGVAIKNANKAELTILNGLYN